MAMYPIYFNLLPTKLGKGTGKKLVDDAAVSEFAQKLKGLVANAQVLVKDPKAPKKETPVKKYETDINSMNPKPATGFTFSSTITEISISVVGTVSHVGIRISGTLSDWQAGTKGTGELAGGFLTASGKTQDSGTDERKQALFASDVAKAVAADIFNKLEGAIKQKLTKP